MADSTFFTSALYPLSVVESMSVAVPAAMSGRDVEGTGEGMSTAVPPWRSGTLIVTVPSNYTSADNEPMAVPVPSLVAGTLVATIRSNYTATTVETVALAVPAFQSGTLK